ncbi:NEP1-interacting protein-like 1 [Camellia lanceoleosa]|uniref:NEP1-interacting protein-like 1 n=1 Tax=Camellia lanceoleosa TaxID=1840588 RepID=A0ACC0IX44_9ERIC|nr:NEP1-interacting protein-like 1 [Camellia lanceoleosa]
MEVYGYPSHSLPSSSSASPSFSFGNLVEKVRDFFGFAVSAIIGNIFSAFFTFFFALVGTLLGAMTGALIGQETESGFVRGAAVGAISGAVFSIEVFESSLLLWQSDESGIGCLLYLIDVLASLLSGRLVRERIGPAMLSAVQSQMGAVEPSFDDIPNLFDIGGSKGLPEIQLKRSQRSKSLAITMSMPLGRKLHVQYAFRTFRLERLLEVCLIVITCFTYLALINGW